MVGIYGIHNKVNDKWYVGQAQNIKKRNYNELLNLKNCNRFHSGKRDNKHIVDAWKKYGENAFEWVVLEECEIDKLDEREIFWIKEKDSYKNGYNQTLGGGGLRGKICSIETRLKMSNSRKGKKRSEDAIRNISLAKQGNKNPMFGKKLSEETKRKMSISQLKAIKPRKPVICVETGVVYSSIHEASRMLNANISKISAVCNGKRKTTNKLTFRFYKEN